jgi:hypothetical protein
MLTFIFAICQHRCHLHNIAMSTILRLHIIYDIMIIFSLSINKNHDTIIKYHNLLHQNTELIWYRATLQCWQSERCKLVKKVYTMLTQNWINIIDMTLNFLIFIALCSHCQCRQCKRKIGIPHTKPSAKYCGVQYFSISFPHYNIPAPV